MRNFAIAAATGLMAAGCSGVIGPRFIPADDDAGEAAAPHADVTEADADAGPDAPLEAVNPVDAGWCRSADGLQALPLPPSGCGFYTGVAYCAACVDGGCAPVRSGFLGSVFEGTCP